jgi:hypothetical protein
MAGRFLKKKKKNAFGKRLQRDVTLTRAVATNVSLQIGRTGLRTVTGREKKNILK